MNCIESDLGIEASAAFRALVEGMVDCTNWRVHFEQDYGTLQQQLLDGEWDRVGTSAEQREAGFSPLDACRIAEVWGGALVPLPLIPTIALRRRALTGPEAQDHSMLLTCALPAVNGGSVIPYFGMTSAVVAAEGRIVNASALGEVTVDRIDPVMPLAYSTHPGLADADIVNGLYALFAAEAIGCAEVVLRRAMQYAGERSAFGKKLVGFQALRHRLADIYRDVEISRGALVRAIAEPGHAQISAAFVFQRCRAAVEGAIQVHGGFGFTWDSGLHFFLRHVMALGDLVAMTMPGGGSPFQGEGVVSQA